MGALELSTTNLRVLACPEATIARSITSDQSVTAVELGIVSSPEKNTHASNVVLFPGLSKRRWVRVQKLHDHLHTEKFDKFFRPVSLVQVETAMEFLDTHFGRWDGDEDLAVWEYLLPAIHKLFPEHRLYGFTASFGPPKPVATKWSFPHLLILSTTAVIFGIGILWYALEK